MSYAVVDASLQDGRPVILYEFVQGGMIWRYTSADQDVVWNGATWVVAPVSHSDVTQSGEMTKDGLTIKFPRDHAFGARYLGAGDDQVTSVTVRRGHYQDGEFIVLWKGRVASSKVTGNSIALECESIFTSLRRPGLRARYQRTCRHAVYARGCTLDPEAFAVAGRAMAAAVNVVTVPEAAAQPDTWYLGGMLRAPDGALRLIVAHAGDQITLSRPIDSLLLALAGSGYGLAYGEYYGGVAVTLYPGCDRTRATCAGKFNNLANYGGFPFIPTKNPFGGSSIV